MLGTRDRSGRIAFLSNFRFCEFSSLHAISANVASERRAAATVVGLLSAAASEFLLAAKKIPVGGLQANPKSSGSSRSLKAPSLVVLISFTKTVMLRS